MLLHVDSLWKPLHVLFQWNQGSSWLCPTDTPQASWEDLWSCIWGDYWYTGGQTSKHYTSAYFVSERGILSNKYGYQESCVQGTANMPAVKVGPALTKNRTVAEQTPQSHFHFHPYIQVNTRQWQRVLWRGEHLHIDTTLCPPRTVATTALEKIWQHHLTNGCYIQNHKVRVSPVLSCSEDKRWLFSSYSVVGEFVV